MGRRYISRIRFKWKTPNWQEFENLNALWFYSHNGIPSFEMEIEKSVQIPEYDMVHARNSKHSSDPQFVMVRDPHMIALIGEAIKTTTIRGARGKFVYLGNITLSKKDTPFVIPLYSSLEDWFDWSTSIQKLESKIH